MTDHSNVIFKVKLFQELFDILSKSGWCYHKVQDVVCFMFEYFSIPVLPSCNIQMALLTVTDSNVNQ